MPRRALSLFIAAATFAPAGLASAQPPSHAAERKLAHDAAEAVCKQEHAAKGEKAFRAAYGAKSPTSVCIKRRLPVATEVLASCRGEKASTGTAAFQKKWGPKGALRNCLLSGISTTRVSG